MMSPDMCAAIGTNGLVNIRVGAIIEKNGKLLMVKTEYADYLYSVGGHLHFGETSEEAVVREVEEETGRRLKPTRLGFVHESYYRGKSPAKMGKEVYEISLYYFMDVPEDFEPASREFREGENKEYLVWVSADDPRPIFPEFFRTELQHENPCVRHIITREPTSGH